MDPREIGRNHDDGKYIDDDRERDFLSEAFWSSVMSGVVAR
jgi:hypothetical protein